MIALHCCKVAIKHSRALATRRPPRPPRPPRPFSSPSPPNSATGHITSPSLTIRLPTSNPSTFPPSHEPPNLPRNPCDTAFSPTSRVPGQQFLGFLQSFHVATLKKLEIYQLYPADLGSFIRLRKENGFLSGEEGLILDILTIYTRKWITRPWRRSSSPTDIYCNLPRSARWLRALCKLKGLKQLDVKFHNRDLVDEYRDAGAFIQVLMDEYRATTEGCLDEQEQDRFTMWYRNDGSSFDERITVLHTSEIRLHADPEWKKKDLKTLLERSECVLSDTGVMGLTKRVGVGEIKVCLGLFAYGPDSTF